MITAADIVRADFGDALELIIFLVVVAVSAIAGLLQKWLQRREQQQAEERKQRNIHGHKQADERRASGSRRDADEQRSRYKPIPQTRSAQSQTGTRAQARPGARRRPAYGADPRLKRQAERVFQVGADGPPSEPPPSPFPQPEQVRIETTPPKPPSAAQRRAQLRAARRRARRKAAAERSIAESELGSSSEGTRRAGDAPRIVVDLGTADEARRAILYHEILAPPKALTTGEELWDR
ncbi:MAG: hypothetical protein KGY99_06720 [Phycisphaerae bacterium]|nr:hypothetical protein [Phycisphaerae bacterium]